MRASPQNTLFGKMTRRPVLFVFLLVCLFLLVREAHELRNNDFTVYWAAVKTTMNGGNPYNPDELREFQILGGVDSAQPLMMYNPPWTLTLIGLFGIFDRATSQLIWLLIHTGALLFCAIQLWHLYNGRANKQWIAGLFAFLFAPTILALALGQITPVILLGITGFVYFAENKRNDWLAGASLVLVSVKPQLTLVLWLAILFWIIQQRRWMIPLASLVIITVLSVALMVFNPSIIQQYLEFVKSSPIPPFATPTIGSFLRYLWIGTDPQWLQFLPFCIGAGWLIIYWRKKLNNSKWVDELPLLLFVSVVTAPFAWTYDYVILLPAIIQVALWLVKNQAQKISILSAGIFIVINLVILLLHLKLSDFWFFWTAPFLFAWYLFMRWQYPISREKRVIVEFR